MALRLLNYLGLKLLGGRRRQFTELLGLQYKERYFKRHRRGRGGRNVWTGVSVSRWDRQTAPSPLPLPRAWQQVLQTSAVFSHHLHLGPALTPQQSHSSAELVRRKMDSELDGSLLAWAIQYPATPANTKMFNISLIVKSSVWILRNISKKQSRQTQIAPAIAYILNNKQKNLLLDLTMIAWLECGLWILDYLMCPFLLSHCRWAPVKTELRVFSS